MLSVATVAWRHWRRVTFRSHCRSATDTNIPSRQEGQDNPQDLTPEPEQRSVNGWESLDGVDLSAVYRTRFAVLQNCPFQFRGRFRLAARQALEARQEAVLNHDVERRFVLGSSSVYSRSCCCADHAPREKLGKRSCAIDLTSLVPEIGRVS